MSGLTLLDLPEELVLDLCSYLSGLDVFRLSQSCRGLRHVLQQQQQTGGGRLWQQMLQRDGLLPEQPCLQSEVVNYSGGCVEDKRISYILHRRLKSNWQRGRFRSASIPLNDGARAGHDDRHLVVMSRLGGQLSKASWNLRAWDIGGRGHKEVAVHFNWSPRKDNNNSNAHLEMNLASVMVADGCAIVTFGGGKGTPQEIIACDIMNGFSELWRDLTHDWGQFNLPRLFGRGVYKFDLLRSTIEIFDVRTFVRTHSLVLSEAMRYPRGDISGDGGGQHLVIPGKMSHNNSPAISVWTLQQQEGGGGDARQRFLMPNQAFCPYRWFEKTCVKSGLVYGLLNRRCLLIWDAETEECIRNIELTNSSPGDNVEPALAFTFLAAAGASLVATISPLPGDVGLFGVRGEKIGVLKGRDHRLKACDVVSNDYCVLARLVNFSVPGFEVVSCPLATTAPPAQGSSSSLATAELFPEFRINLAPTNDCVLQELGMTPTKLLNFCKNELVLFDFMW